MHCCSTEAAKSSKFFEKSMILKDVTDESPNVLSGESVLDLVQMSVGKSETDKSSGIEICVNPCGIGIIRNFRRDPVKMILNVLEREEELSASFRSMEVVDAKFVRKVST